MQNLILTTAERKELDRKRHGELIQVPLCKGSHSLFLDSKYDTHSPGQESTVFLEEFATGT